MVELIERRVTRSLSNELQNRGQGHLQSQNHTQQPHSQSLRGKSHLLYNGDGLHPKVGHFALEQLRTTSEEILIRTLVDGSITGSSPTTIDCLGFANLPPTYRKDSEELFHAWLNIDGHGEVASSHNTWQQARQKYAAMQAISPLSPSLQAANISIMQGPCEGSPALACGGGGHVHNELQPLDAFNASIPGPSLSKMVSMLKESLECRRLAQMRQQHEGASQQAEPPGRAGQIDAAEEACDQSRMGHIAVQSPRVASIGDAPPCVSTGGPLALSAGVKLISKFLPSYSGTPISMSQNSLKRTSHPVGVVEQPPDEKVSHGGIERTPHVSSGREGYLKGWPSIGKKAQWLTRAGSLISSARSGVAKDGLSPTKLRRVERREKMLESKERPVVPSDLQIGLKRRNALEKEVRSLKLNLSFMNRKDSEQTKRIEELEKENHELQHEKERLLEEVERLASCHPY